MLWTRGARDADRVDAQMLEEARVLGGEDGPPDALGQVLDRDPDAIGALAAQRLGEQLRLEPGVGVAADRPSVAPSPSRRPRTFPVRASRSSPNNSAGRSSPRA